MKKLYSLIAMFVRAVGIMACSDKNKELFSSIDKNLTKYVDSVLLSIKDSLKADDSGIIIVANTESEHIRAMCCGCRGLKGERQGCYHSEQSSVGQVATEQAALETEKIHLTDTVDTGIGNLNIHDQMLIGHS